MISSTGDEWWTNYTLNGRMNTGTYSSQWVVIDFNKVNASRGQALLQPGTVLVGETIPGFVASKDISQLISQHG